MHSFVVEEAEREDTRGQSPSYQRYFRKASAGHWFSLKRSIIKSPLLDRSPREKVLATFSGRIEDVDKQKVYVTLARDGEFFEGEFAKTTFAPGAKIVKGRGTITEQVALPSGHIVWRNRVLKPKVVAPEILEEMRARLDAEFDGTGL